MIGYVLEENLFPPPPPPHNVCNVWIKVYAQVLYVLFARMMSFSSGRLAFADVAKFPSYSHIENHTDRSAFWGVFRLSSSFRTCIYVRPSTQINKRVTSPDAIGHFNKIFIESVVQFITDMEVD